MTPGTSTDRGQNLTQLQLWGISHRTAPLDHLGQLALSNQEIERVSQKLLSHNEIYDCMVLSTCNRTEIYTHSGSETPTQVTDTLASVTGSQRIPSNEFVYTLNGLDCLKHLFQVTCGLDSMILGEAQILGQVKSAFEKCQSHEKHSSLLTGAVQSALKTASKSRSITSIGAGAVSVASASVHLAHRIFSDLSRRRALVVGAGETGRLLAEHLVKQGVGHLTILNRTLAKAESLSRSMGVKSAPLDTLREHLAEADILACAVSSNEALIDYSLIKASMQQRPGRVLAILDVGMPKNVAPEVNKIPNVFVHDLESIKQVVDQNLALRRQVVPEVENLIVCEIDRLLQRQKSVEVGPLITSMRQAVEEIRQEEIRRLGTNLSEREKDNVERVTRAVMNKILHGPTQAIKDIALNQNANADRLEAVGNMFKNLNPPKD
jgi:glutamyl-tRNA reductase